MDLLLQNCLSCRPFSPCPEHAGFSGGSRDHHDLVTGGDVGCTSEPLSGTCRISVAVSGLTVEQTAEVVDPFSTGSRGRTLLATTAEPGRRADLR